MTIRKSVISVAAAAAIIASFTGCGDDDINTVKSSESNSTQNINNVANNNRITNPKGTVTGTVMDTNGNPIKDVSVSLAGQTTKTDAGGIYVFTDVPVTSTNNPTTTPNANVNALSVTISAPKGYLGATVTVYPQAQQISSGTGPADGETNPNTNFIDGYLAAAGTAVLPKLGAKVTGRLENTLTGEPIPNQEISLDFRGVNLNNNTNIAQPQDGVRTTYATNTGYAVMTDANGIFNFVRLPMDTNFVYVVPNFTSPTSTNSPANILTTNQETSLQNIGDLNVAPVIQSDTINPYVKGVTGIIGTTNMLEDDVRKTFVVNFSEAMNIQSNENDTPSVIVKAGATPSTMKDVNATTTIGADGKSIVVTLDKELTDNTLLDLNLLVTDFKDKSGRFLSDRNSSNNPTPITYDNLINNNQVLRLSLQIFNDLNTKAPQVKILTQMTTDENGNDDAALLQSSNVAFNDVSDSGTPDNSISQLNAVDSNTRLQALGNAILGVTNVTVNNQVARVQFTPSGASSYNIKLANADGTTQNINNATLTIQNILDIGDINTTVTPSGTVGFTLKDPTDTTPVEMTISGVSAKQVVTITPIDELGYAGTPQSVILKDNVQPTTVLQPSYGLIRANPTNGSGGVKSYGEGGELSAGATAATAGTPYLAITAGLLDNLGNARELNDELYSKSAKELIADTSEDTYDSAAYGKMLKNRTIGVAFSENIKKLKNPDITTITGIDKWVANNDVTREKNGTRVNVDLMNFNSADVIALANNNNGKVIDFTDAVSDISGNIATGDNSNAKVVLIDKMPPFVTKASFDGENVSITFNESIKALTTGSIIKIEDNRTRNTYTARYDSTATAATKAKYVVKGTKLTIETTAFTPTLTRATFNIGAKYAETVYDNEKRGHAKLSWDNIQDTRGNSWVGQSAGVASPSFAVIDMVGDFNLVGQPDTSKFKINSGSKTTTQSVTWHFNHPVSTDANNPKNLFGNLVDGAKEMRYQQEGNVTEANLINPVFSLSDNNKAVTLSFKTPTDSNASLDQIKLREGNTFGIYSAIDPDAKPLAAVLTVNPSSN